MACINKTIDLKMSTSSALLQKICIILVSS